MEFIERPRRVMSNEEVHQRQRTRLAAGFHECNACLCLAEWTCLNCDRQICGFHMSTPDLHGEKRCYGCGSLSVARTRSVAEITARLCYENGGA